MLAPVSARDPYILPERDAIYAKGRSDATGRALFWYPSLPPVAKTLVAVIIGQSNSTNCCDQNYVVTNSEIYNFNVYDGGLYSTQEPLLGCGCDGGHAYAGKLADLLRGAGMFDRVILVPIAIGATSVLDWTPVSGQDVSQPGWRSGAWMWPRIPAMLARLAAAKVPPPNAWLWGQGEEDAGEFITTRVRYAALFGEMTAGVRALGNAAPWFVALQTWIVGGIPATFGSGPTATGGGAIRGAQADVIDHANGIWAGPDADTIGNNGRGDTTHFNHIGRDLLAPLWQTALSAYPF